MADIQIEIQGTDAIAASEELFSLPQISGNWQRVDEVERGEIITTIGAIVGIIGGSIAIAEKIYNWYQKYKQGKSVKKIDKVLLVSKTGKRLLLADATIEQIKAILDD
ncbi:hypothetical protein [Crocosphaera sp.]|uniref:hypothetical protein n=1 Tax=Crocosphaera sp. TaxID=2729996 RepID=UPI00260F4DCD|nr:hypothetical protein [Crocosphaera sp.]MDJ0581031.1 hypothetical protein [Crocosphaera sp.]